MARDNASKFILCGLSGPTSGMVLRCYSICNRCSRESNISGEMCSDGFFDSEEEEWVGQAQAWRWTFAFVESLTVKCAVLLGIPDMIFGEGLRGTLSLTEIVARLPRESPDASCLFRIMCFLVAKGVF